MVVVGSVVARGMHEVVSKALERRLVLLLPLPLASLLGKREQWRGLVAVFLAVVAHETQEAKHRLQLVHVAWMRERLDHSDVAVRKRRAAHLRNGEAIEVVVPVAHERLGCRELHVVDVQVSQKVLRVLLELVKRHYAIFQRRCREHEVIDPRRQPFLCALRHAVLDLVVESSLDRRCVAPAKPQPRWRHLLIPIADIGPFGHPRGHDLAAPRCQREPVESSKRVRA